MSREGRSESPFSDFPAGATILRQGEPASALFIIEAGKVAIERSDAPGVVLAELGPGEFFGEMAILQEAPHSANVVARTVVRALRIDVASFHAVLRENAEVSVHLMRRWCSACVPGKPVASNWKRNWHGVVVPRRLRPRRRTRGTQRRAIVDRGDRA
ncbi:MAG: cyclic nucleotide-binding domain-containing protein [Chiayiivirga sp.]|jgi:hypothetical protein|uniref:cyclic nucleotide-binding domain-containing protein n=1 Tax=Chiayiivirga sp. TaxID=2041042 RepID=UPI0025C336A5|nr:cyclic nucleotide-binding domain-containing protein [Chiayiivirga sp.]MCI1730653.1 cyclic nucleotide-binding domain-containing protein [Chiayiivirga sp.]